MDEIVLRAIAKWPDVPAVYGWLSLDRRGNWFIKGQRIVNNAIAQFIGRNYAKDERMGWFFQNGPQRVYVALAYTPFVYRTRPTPNNDLELVAHTGVSPGAVTCAWIDETGALLVEAELGIGLLHDQDLSDVLNRLVGVSGEPLDEGALDQLVAFSAQLGSGPAARLLLGADPVPVATISCAEVAARFGFDPDPRPAAGGPDC